jgi:hypothetical protein
VPTLADTSAKRIPRPIRLPPNTNRDQLNVVTGLNLPSGPMTVR